MTVKESRRGLVITHLPLEDMALLAVGLPLNEGVERVLAALLEGKRVAVVTNAFEYKKFRFTASPGVYRKFTAMERQLRELGLVRAGEEETRL